MCWSFPSRDPGYSGSVGSGLRFGRGHQSDQFYETGDDAEDQSGKVQPGGVQPAIECGTDQPADNRSGRKDEGQLAVVGQLQDPVLLLLRGLAVLRHGFLAPGVSVSDAPAEKSRS